MLQPRRVQAGPGAHGCQVFRHGDHTPQEFFPTDNHKEIARQQGYGQLTKIYVQSTDCDNTLMSAQASLAGLYPLTQSQIWNPRILWQPIPVHTVPLSQDNDTNNYTLPVWATHGVRTKLIKLSELLLQAEFGFYKQMQKSRLQGVDRTFCQQSYCPQLFRHGDRTPIVNFPTDLHKESEWPQGFGQLTKTGMQQLFELGQYMRKRYSSFLNSTYNRQEFYIQSTDYDRTIMSAQSYLSGLFPPTSSQIWNPELLWQPIPVHIFQKTTEQRLNFPLPNCPRFDELQHETQTSKEFQDRIQPYMDFLQTMAVNTGLELNHLKILDNFQLWNTYDTLHCEDIHNYTLPVWATEDVINKMEKLAELSLLSLFGVYKTEEKSRLQGGVLVNIILNSIKQAVNSSAPRKMEVYSAVSIFIIYKSCFDFTSKHDTTVGALQIALNIFNGKLPPYAACQFFELYQESNGQVSS
ncbi:hypothetical protein TURU_113439 [Turdus rufiventris]|nr:hypothetical protein TURU_113439 [Turdus rufiventris]